MNNEEITAAIDKAAQAICGQHSGFPRTKVAEIIAAHVLPELNRVDTEARREQKGADAKIAERKKAEYEEKIDLLIATDIETASAWACWASAAGDIRDAIRNGEQPR